MSDLNQRVYEKICQACGDEFDHPGSCEICLDDPRMDALRNYEIEQAKKQGEDYFNN